MGVTFSSISKGKWLLTIQMQDDTNNLRKQSRFVVLHDCTRINLIEAVEAILPIPTCDQAVQLDPAT